MATRKKTTTFNYDEMKKSIAALADAYKIPGEVANKIIKDAIAKGYRKHLEITDINIRVEFNDEDKQIHLYQQRLVVEEIMETEDVEITLEDAQKINPDALLGDIIEEEVPFSESYVDFGRADISVVKNYLKQSSREAQKDEIYGKFIDKKGEMVQGIIDKVEEKVVFVNIDGTEAVLPKSFQMPQEYYRKDEPIKVVIADVNKDSKGSQVIVSRSDANLVKRLFESSVPEIFQGVVEIKAIAREVGERTKMAVMSHNKDVDPIGACIGTRGKRVQDVIEELKGEKIDIFAWSDDIEDLIKNSLSPATIQGVIIDKENENQLTVVVEDNQLSLAIGRKGNNVRLAVTLTDKHIDIKSISQLEQEGIDWLSEIERSRTVLEEKRQAAAAETRRREAELELQRKEAEMAAAREIMAQVEKEEELKKQQEEDEAVEIAIEEETEDVPLFDEVKTEEPVEEKKPEEKPKKKKTRVVSSDYVSKFEALADASKQNQADNKSKSKYKKKDSDEEHKLKLKDMLQDKQYEFKPEYTDEEMAEIQEQEEYDEYLKYDDDIDYDEYDKYYDEEDDN